MGNQPFKLIEGDWQSSPEWLALPSAIAAPSPLNKDQLTSVRVCKADVIKAADQRRRQPALDFWSILGGALPPIPGAERMVEFDDQDLSRLTDAYACFSGIKRPCGSDDTGATTIAYILKPKTLFAYDSRPPVFWMRKQSVPRDLVFVAYVRLDVVGDAASDTGILTHWQFAEADENDPTLPHDFENRFVNRLW